MMMMMTMIMYAKKDDDDYVRKKDHDDIDDDYVCKKDYDDDHARKKDDDDDDYVRTAPPSPSASLSGGSFRGAFSPTYGSPTRHRVQIQMWIQTQIKKQVWIQIQIQIKYKSSDKRYKYRKIKECSVRCLAACSIFRILMTAMPCVCNNCKSENKDKGITKVITRYKIVFFLYM